MLIDQSQSRWYERTQPAGLVEQVDTCLAKLVLFELTDHLPAEASEDDDREQKQDRRKKERPHVLQTR